jgi:hypothetical protein
MTVEYVMVYNTELANCSSSVMLIQNGGISGFDYVMNASNLDEFKARAFGLFTQLAVIVVATYIFAWGTHRSIINIWHMPYGFISWCCFLQALIGFLSNLINIITKLSSWPICRHQIQINAVGVCMGRMTINALLLAKAYYANEKSRKLLIFGSIAILFESTTAYALLARSSYVLTDFGSCTIRYPEWFPWTYALIDAPIHAVFSIAFIVVVIRYYRRFGSNAWKELRRNSIAFLFSIVLFKLLMLVLVLHEVAGDATGIFGLIEWVVCSCLVIHEHNSIRHALKHTDEEVKVSDSTSIRYETSIIEPGCHSYSYYRLSSHDRSGFSAQRDFVPIHSTIHEA